MICVKLERMHIPELCKHDHTRVFQCESVAYVFSGHKAVTFNLARWAVVPCWVYRVLSFGPVPSDYNGEILDQ